MNGTPALPVDFPLKSSNDYGERTGSIAGFWVATSHSATCGVE